MLTQEQLLERLNYVTGSDAASILGVSKFKSAYELWMEKTRRSVAPDISDRPTVKAGNMLEEAVGKWFTYETGKAISKPDKMLIHKEHDWMAANIDGFIKDENAIIEIKTSSSDKGWGEQGENIIPDHYLCQVAHYCAVTDVERAYIAVLIRGIDFRYYVYERDLELENILIEKEKHFWYENVLKDAAPALGSSNDVMLMLQHKSEDTTKVANQDIMNILEELKETTVQIKALAMKEKELKERVCMFMEESETLLNINGKPCVTWKYTKPTKRLDTKRFKEEMPEVYEKYVKESQGTRRFNIKKED